MTSDHLPVLLKLKMKRNITNNIKTNFPKIKSYNFDKADWGGFKNALPSSFNTNTEDNVDKLEEFIRNNIINASNQFIPYYENIGIKSKKLPEHILDLIKARKLARKISNKDPHCKSAKKLYNKLTEVIRDENRATKDKEWSSFVDKLGKNPPSTKPFWSRINNIRGKKNKQPIPTLKVDNITYESDEQKANLFSSILQKTFSLESDNQFNDK